MKELFIEMICDADFETRVQSGCRKEYTIESIIKIWEDDENGHTN